MKDFVRNLLIMTALVAPGLAFAAGVGVGRVAERARYSSRSDTSAGRRSAWDGLFTATFNAAYRECGCDDGLGPEYQSLAEKYRRLYDMSGEPARGELDALLVERVKISAKEDREDYDPQVARKAYDLACKKLNCEPWKSSIEQALDR
jgi:hypothetical protein